MRIRSIMITLLTVLVAVGASQVAAQADPPDPGAPIFKKYEERDVGGVHFRYPRKAFVLGKLVQVLPVESQAPEARQGHITLTLLGATTPIYDEVVGLLDSKVTAIPLRDVTAPGIYRLDVTVTLPGTTTVVGEFHRKIHIR
jgi:hypothetical protein